MPTKVSLAPLGEAALGTTIWKHGLHQHAAPQSRQVWPTRFEAAPHVAEGLLRKSSKQLMHEKKQKATSQLGKQLVASRREQECFGQGLVAGAMQATEEAKHQTQQAKTNAENETVGRASKGFT